MSDFKSQLEDIKKKINQKKIDQAKLEQQLEDLEKEKKELDTKLTELNIASVDDLEKAIIILEQDISEGLKTCQKLLA